ncbi:nuclease-related domain-containing protein [Caballeronia sp. M23-90]
MFFEMLIAGAAIYGYRQFVKRPHANKAGNASWWAPAAERAQASGLLGEKRTQAKLTEALGWCCGTDYYLHEGSLIIEHAPGTRFPTIEIDHLAVTPFGIFIFETKNWSGVIEPSSNPDLLVRTTTDGKTEERKSPTAQNRTKLAFLRSVLPRGWNIQGVGVFASPECQFSATLDTDLICIDELPFWLRNQRHRGNGALIDIAMAVKAIRKFEDTAPDAAIAHKRRIYQNQSAVSRSI